MRWFALLLLIDILAVVVACGEEETAPEEIAAPTVVAEVTDIPSVTYTLDFTASATGDAGIEILGTTNLPEGALVRVSASRAGRWQGEEDIRSVSLADSTVSVTNGQFTTSLALDESDLLVLVGNADVLDVQSDSVTVCAEFQTGEDLDEQQRQPNPSVVEAVGPFGERLANSPQVTVFGSATANPANWLEIQASVALEPLLLDEIAAREGRAPTIGALEGFCL